MIIKSIRLNPFAGIADKQLSFDKGLNVVLGPNEAGKSTLFNALLHLLFTESKPGKRVFDKEMKPFIPVGGDTAQAILDFQTGKDLWQLTKVWGANPSVQLKHKDGQLLSDDAGVAEQLAGLLPATQGTFKSVLLVRQAGLQHTVGELKSDYNETVRDLGDMLRQTVVAMEGVSLERMKQVLADKIDAQFDHWDRDAEYPEGDRGVHDPWKRGVGKILAAWYAMEEVREELQGAERFEQELAALNAQLSETASRHSELKIYLEKNESIMQDALKRRGLQAALANANRLIKEMKAAAKDWPIAEEKLKNVGKERVKLEKQIAALEDEQRKADAIERAKELRKQFDQARKKDGELKELEKQLKGMQSVSDQQLKKVQKLDSEIRGTRAGLEAGELSFSMRAKKAIAFALTADLGAAEQLELAKDDTIQRSATGRISLTHPDWEIEIESGSEAFKKLEASLKKNQAELEKLLKTLKADNVDQVPDLYSAFTKQSDKVEQVREQLEEILGEETLKSLEQQLAAIPDGKDIRDHKEVYKELVAAQSRLETLEQEAEEAKEKVTACVEEYGSQDDLLGEQIPEQVQESKQCAAQLKQLQPLPEGIDDLDAFVREVEERKQQLEEAQDRLTELHREKAELNKDTPEATAEELAPLLKDNEKQFEREQQIGASLLEINRTLQELMESGDTDPWDGFAAQLASSLATLTDNRYRTVTITDGIPDALQRDNGRELGIALLSDGTQDIFALALRLTMAGYFLGDAAGFLAMDDPLVDLDPERREKSIALLQSFAEQRQLLLFTCHPQHAELLGGNLVELQERA